MKKIVQTPDAPAAIGPYSQAWISGGMLFTSGQLGLDPATNALPETVEDQARQSLKNIHAILEEAGFHKEDVVKTTVFLKNMSDFAAVNGIYAGYFGPDYPARSCIEVSKLPMGGGIEVEAVVALR